MWEKGDECGGSSAEQGTFSVFEIKNKEEEDPREKKNQPRNSLQQLVCFIGVWQKGRK